MFRKIFPKKKKLILHVGTHKTGTTYLQRILLKNKYKLLMQGILYPTTKYHPVGQQRLAYAFNNMNSPHIKSSDTKELDNVFLELKRYLNDEDHKFLLISSENISPNSEPRLLNLIKNFFSGYEVHVFIYVRRQDDYIESLYREHIKIPNCEKSYFADFKSPHPLDYNDLIHRWEKVFGSDRVNVKSYDIAKSSPGGLWKDFINGFDHIVRVDDSDFSITKDANTTISNVAIELMRAGNNFPLDLAVRATYNSGIVKFCNGAGYGDVWRLPLKENYMDAFDKENRMLFDKYFGGVDIFCQREKNATSLKDKFDESEILNHYARYSSGFEYRDSSNFKGFINAVDRFFSIQ